MDRFRSRLPLLSYSRLRLCSFALLPLRLPLQDHSRHRSSRLISPLTGCATTAIVLESGNEENFPVVAVGSDGKDIIKTSRWCPIKTEGGT